MKIKTSELEGAALDYAVCICEGVKYIGTQSSYSISWLIAGPIIERESISLDIDIVSGEWVANGFMYGDTPLIAAMRCYVTSKMGDDVEVPEGII